ncbi:MAG: glycosyltransferase, partial [Clostridia bacterium]|nr:glycosyltransferase [Clostridia bacterium]
MSKIKVLMVLGNTGRGGAQTFATNVLRIIDRNRFQIDFAVNDDRSNGYSQEIIALGSKIYVLPYFRIYNWHGYTSAWRRLLRENHYDIVHGNVSSSAYVYLNIAKEFGCTAIAHSHSSGYRGNFFERCVKRIFSYGVRFAAEYHFACTDFAAKRLFGKKFNLYDKYYLIPNAIIPEKFLFNNAVRQKIRKDYAFDEKTKIYGHVGSFTKPKNHFFLIDVFECIVYKKSDSVLLLLGEGELEQEVKRYVIGKGLEKNVLFLGNRGNINEYLMAMDAMIFPSFFEGVPITLVEAQASGLPVIASDTITDDVFLTDCIIRMSLNNSPDAWADRAVGLK